MKIKVEAKGVSETISKISAFNIKAKEAVKKQVGKSALNIQREAKKRCPVDTGALRNSITTDFYNDDLAAEIGPHMPYAAYVEFGTKRTKAQPYLFPAYEKEKPELKKGIKEAIKGAAK